MPAGGSYQAEARLELSTIQVIVRILMRCCTLCRIAQMLIQSLSQSGSFVNVQARLLRRDHSHIIFSYQCF